MLPQEADWRGMSVSKAIPKNNLPRLGMEYVNGIIWAGNLRSDERWHMRRLSFPACGSRQGSREASCGANARQLPWSRVTPVAITGARPL